MTREEAIKLIHERLISKNGRINGSLKSRYDSFLQKLWFKQLKEEYLNKVLQDEPIYDSEIDKCRIYFFLRGENPRTLPKCPVCKKNPLTFRGLEVGFSKVCSSKYCMGVYGKEHGGKVKGTSSKPKPKIDTNIIREIVENNDTNKLLEFLKQTTFDSQGRPAIQMLTALINNFPELGEYIEKVRDERFSWIQDDVFKTGYKELIYCLEHNIMSPPRCPICGSIVGFKNFKAGYLKICRNKYCQSQWSLQNRKYTRSKMSEKTLRRIIQDYGSIENWQKIIEEKRKKTLQEKYGVTHQMHIPEIKEQVTKKATETRIRKLTDQFLILCKSSGFEVLQMDHIYATIKHKKCGHVFRSPIYYTKFITCPVCDPYRSKLEQIVTEWLKEHCSYSLLSNKRLLYDNHTLLEIDIYIPQINLGIECNGLSYHVTRKNPTKYKVSVPRDYHIKKSMLARKAGIRLIHLWEDWLLEKFDVCMSHISKYFENNLCEKIHVKDCNLEKLSLQEAADFLNEYHLEGFKNQQSLTCYGLEYKGELVSVLTVGLNMQKQWEISRFSTKSFTEVENGFVKLLDGVQKDLKLKTLIARSYIELDNFPEDTVYARNGFELVLNGGKLYFPTYYGFIEDPHVRVHRLNITKTSIIPTLRSYNVGKDKINQIKRIIDQGRTEEDYMSIVGGIIWSGYFQFMKHY